ncbi:hypothetical protein ACQZ6B_01390 [Agrobacterium vitis]
MRKHDSKAIAQSEARNFRHSRRQFFGDVGLAGVVLALPASAIAAPELTVEQRLAAALHDVCSILAEIRGGTWISCPGYDNARPDMDFVLLRPLKAGELAA